MLTDPIPVPRMNEKWTVRLVGFAPFHVVARRHHQVGGPANLLTKAIEHWRCRLCDAIIAVALASHAHESTDAVLSIDQPPRAKGLAPKREYFEPKAAFRRAECIIPLSGIVAFCGRQMTGRGVIISTDPATGI